MLETIKQFLLLEDDSFDSVINALITSCGEQYKALTHQTEIVEYIVVQMVIESFNRLGNEGIASKSFSGITETPLNGYSENVQSLIKVNRKLRVI